MVRKARAGPALRMEQSVKSRQPTRAIPVVLKTRMDVEAFIKMQLEVSAGDMDLVDSTQEKSQSRRSSNPISEDPFEFAESVRARSDKTIAWFGGESIRLSKLNERLKDYRGITNVELGTVEKGVSVFKKDVPCVYLYSNVNILPGITKLKKTKRFLDKKAVDDLVLEEEIDSFRLIRLISMRYELVTPEQKQKLLEKIVSGVYVPVEVEVSRDEEKELLPIYLRMAYDERHENDPDLMKRLEKARREWNLSPEDIEIALKKKYRTGLGGKPALLLKEFDLFWKRPPELKFTLVMDVKRTKKQSSVSLEEDSMSVLIENFMKGVDS